MNIQKNHIQIHYKSKKRINSIGPKIYKYSTAIMIRMITCIKTPKYIYPTGNMMMMMMINNRLAKILINNKPQAFSFATLKIKTRLISSLTNKII